MATVDLNVAGKKDWLFANPWLWLAAGAVVSLWSLVWTLPFGELASDNRVIVLALGLLLAGVGVWIRWNDRHTLYIAPCSARLAGLARLAMAALFALVALAITIVLIMACFWSAQSGFHPGATLLVWLTITPVSAAAARRCLKRQPKQPALETDEEVALSLIAAAGIAFAGSWSLYLGAALVDDWDSIRMFLRVLTSVGLLAAGLVTVSIGLRRLILSFLVLLHFGGIATACLSAPPAPWAIQQIWVRIYRPYLQFMYLNNAYHFYAPEPGPSSYIWFRLVYASPEGQNFGMWYKIPEVDHPDRMYYQRQLSLTQETSGTDPPPPGVITNEKGKMEAHPRFANRFRQIPGQQFAVGEQGANPRFMLAPMHPAIPQMQQLAIPNEQAKRLVSSYARFVARKFAQHPDNPTWTLKSVKAYRVVHAILLSAQLNNGISPTDPELNRAYYLGNYRPDGSEIDLDDPYLYWLLPVLRDNPNDPNSAITDFARRHAGDPLWYRPQNSTDWIAPREQGP